MGLSFTLTRDYEYDGLKISYVLSEYRMDFRMWFSIMWGGVLVGIGAEQIWREVKVIRSGC